MKFDTGYFVGFCLSLLIAPKGIEICFIDRRILPFFKSFNRTKRNWNHAGVSPAKHHTLLLIAPKGIEIGLEPWCMPIWIPFNRTKRNWNIFTGDDESLGTITFNRTKRNWNQIEAVQGENAIEAFNRTKRNWNSDYHCF